MFPTLEMTASLTYGDSWIFHAILKDCLYTFSKMYHF